MVGFSIQLSVDDCFVALKKYVEPRRSRRDTLVYRKRITNTRPWNQKSYRLMVMNPLRNEHYALIVIQLGVRHQGKIPFMVYISRRIQIRDFVFQ
jgi:hypothetical protein